MERSTFQFPTGHLYIQVKIDHNLAKVAAMSLQYYRMGFLLRRKEPQIQVSHVTLRIAHEKSIGDVQKRQQRTDLSGRNGVGNSVLPGT